MTEFAEAQRSQSCGHLRAASMVPRGFRAHEAFERALGRTRHHSDTSQGVFKRFMRSETSLAEPGTPRSGAWGPCGIGRWLFFANFLCDLCASVNSVLDQFLNGILACKNALNASMASM